MCQSRPAPIEYANVPANMLGPIIVAMPARLPIAPCSSPCAEGPTRRVDQPPAHAAPASPHNATIGMPAANAMPVGASAYTVKPTAPANKQPGHQHAPLAEAAHERSDEPPCTIIEHTPTPASTRPTLISFHP